jgi:3-deoxy-D-manno-octulosonic-acid transferase
MLVYRLFIFLYPLAAQLISWVSPKARLWCEGQKIAFNQIKDWNPGKPVIWMHCASLGEFEQGLPVLESFHQQYPGYALLVSFFSPSGYEACKNHSLPDRVVYLPMDSPSQSREWLAIVKPAFVLFIKYEFWYYYLSTLQQQKIPVILVSAIFRQQQIFFTWYGGFYRKMLGLFTHILVQDEASVKLLSEIQVTTPVIIAGDTRFDRVQQIANQPKSWPAIENFVQQHPVLVAGSTWPEDDKELQHFVNNHPAVKHILVPHLTDAASLQQCQETFPGALLYSAYEAAFLQGIPISDSSLLIIDRIGMLSSLYRYASVAYIGGGFGADGVHNVLEAAVYGKPVIMGPTFQKYLEATELVDKGGAITVNNGQALDSALQALFDNETERKKMGQIALDYTVSKRGATNKVLQVIQENRLLIK